MAEQTWGAFPVRMSDLSSFQITSRSQCGAQPASARDAGQQVFR